MGYFFTLGENMTDFSQAFGLFTGQHAFALGLTLVWLIYTIKDYKKRSDKARYRKIYAWVIWATIASRHIVEFATGQYTVHRLPLHLCTVFSLFKLIDAYVENKYTKEVLIILTMPAALLANLFPDWANQPLLNFNTFQQFIFHALIINYGLMRYNACEIKPNLKNIWMPFTALAGVLPFIFFINSQLGTNFFFVSTYSPGSPLEILYHAFGPFYVPAVASVKILLWLLIYGILRICRHIGQNQLKLGNARNKVSA